MSDDPHLTDAPGHADAVAHHATDDHGDEHGHDDHAHGDEPLGPLDVPAWGAGILGVLLGLAVVLAFVLATNPVAPA
ncbi:MAG: hypothetical protein H0W22_06970 [Chloroflexi bacterium]|nr:hypothetical protein [Chloroflexota bacterium]